MPSPAKAAVPGQPRKGGSLAATKNATRARIDPSPLAPKPKGKARAPKSATALREVSTSGAEELSIPAPNMKIVEFTIRGTAPYVQNRFGNKAAIMATQAEGSTAKRKKREPKNFEALYENAIHRSQKGGWPGIPAMAFRASCISACRLVGFQMTRAKLAIFIEADDYDVDGDPIVRIEGKPEMHTSHVRNETGVVDIRARPMWRTWSCLLRVRYDADQFTASDIANLVLRAGMQCGIGEGRADSKKSHTGMGWGSFTIAE